MRLGIASLTAGLFNLSCASAPVCPPVSQPAPIVAAPAPALPAPRGTEDQAARVLDDFHDAAAHADEARYFDHLSASSVFLGTDATERWSKSAFQAYAHPRFVLGKAWSFHAARRTIVVAEGGALAWFDEDLTTERLGPARGSGVLVLEGGAWKIAQYNLTLTIPNERFSAVRAAADAPDAPKASEVDADLAPLAWLSGSWMSADGGSEEHWSGAAGGTMIGMGRVVKDGHTELFEALRIERKNGGLVYIASPKGQSTTEFKLTKVSSGSEPEAVFENPKHDYPKRITYRRHGNELVARIEGGGPASERIWKRAALPVK